MDQPEPVRSAAPLIPEQATFGAQLHDAEQAAFVGGGAFRVNDRVPRLNGTTEHTRWGTITGREEGGGWLVRDNLGATHRDRTGNLAAAVRGGARGRHVLPEWLRLQQ
jgi:hypothetical protein